ncbi:4'-phosphopantetheinyl transferase family protein [Floridanema evergladense]|uniref:4'-phosphopantetheinyl transferase superfamily protein n=1 Tax=Floridaenema evergladense BLCC-F167 TaxID=3153639 RepID=A0ABV4WK41_9CYAN
MILWHFPPKNLSLRKDSLHIWRADVDLPIDLLTALAVNLSWDERQRADRFYFERDKKRFIACRGLLRMIISHYLDLEPYKLKFTYSPRGKPELDNNHTQDRLCFNVSHSQNLAVYAIALNRAVGIDLEYTRPLSDLQQLAERFFSPSEASIINALPEAQQQEVFFRLWTIKEAYLKATGEGLAGLQSIVVSFTRENTINLYNIENNVLLNSHWFCTEFNPEPEYKGALVAERKDLEENTVEYFTLTTDYILNH